MKPKTHLTKLHRTAIVLLCVLFVQSCYKEDNTNCGIGVGFRYDRNVDYENKIGSTVSRIDLYIYNSAGNLIEAIPISASGYIPEDYVRELIHITPGTYTLVAWGNISNAVSHNSTRQSSSSSLEGTILSLNHEDGRFRGSETMTLFHAYKEVVVEKGFEGIMPVMMDFTKYSNQIEVTIVGMPMPADRNITDLYSCFITSRNGSYYFDGSYANDEMITYDHFYESIEEEDDSVVYIFNILREDNLNTTKSKLFILHHPIDGGAPNVWAEVDLVEELKKVAGDLLNEKNTGDLDRDDVFRLYIELDFSSATVTIKINDWEPGDQPGVIW